MECMSNVKGRRQKEARQGDSGLCTTESSKQEIKKRDSQRYGVCNVMQWRAGKEDSWYRLAWSTSKWTMWYFPIFFFRPQKQHS